MIEVFTRKLGRSSIEIRALGLGCWAIGGPFFEKATPLGWGEVDDEESMRAIHCALELGINFFDTANVYGAGHSERVLGKTLAGRRSEVVIATKFNALFDEAAREVTGSSCAPADIRMACEDSLRRHTRYRRRVRSGRSPTHASGGMRSQRVLIPFWRRQASVGKESQQSV
jgi:aryl-alcohol dehydrogenase-like predicted oxidoreductase